MQVNRDKEEEVLRPSPGQLCPQLSDLQAELQVCVLALSHRPEQAGVFLIQPVVSVLELSYGCQQVFVLTEHKQALSGKLRTNVLNGNSRWETTYQEH